MTLCKRSSPCLPRSCTHMRSPLASVSNVTIDPNRAQTRFPTHFRLVDQVLRYLRRSVSSHARIVESQCQLSALTEHQKLSQLLESPCNSFNYKLYLEFSPQPNSACVHHFFPMPRIFALRPIQYTKRTQAIDSNSHSMVVPSFLHIEVQFLSFAALLA